MKELNGYILINNKKYPFAFLGEKLKVYPIADNGDIITKDDKYDELIPGVFVCKNKMEKAIDEIELNGKLVDGRKITFKVYNDPTEIEGFCTFVVVSVYIYIPEEKNPIFEEGKANIVEWKVEKNNIDGIIISGREIDFFFNPAEIFEHRYKLDNGSSRFTEFNVTARQNDDENCGKFVLEENDCKILVRSIAKINEESKTPFNSYSELVLNFSKNITLEQVETIIISIQKCFQYLCRRKNIEFSNIETFCNTENGKRRRFGVYQLNWNRNFEETNPKANSQIIDYKILKTSLGQLVQAFINGEMYLNHLPINKDEDRSFGPDRMIFDFVAFEREYQNLYPEIKVRSEAFIGAKELVLTNIEQLIGAATGKKRKYITSIRNSVSKIENSLGERIQYVINDCEDIMKPFLVYNFGKEKYKDDVENMCSKLNQLRNDCAHGNIAINFDETTLTDYNTLECLLYAMRLKTLGISTLEAQRAIAKVMSINMYIPESSH